jgi:hypothetical protein
VLQKQWLQNEQKAENEEHAFNLFHKLFFAVFCHKSIGLKAN